MPPTSPFFLVSAVLLGVGIGYYLYYYRSLLQKNSLAIRVKTQLLQAEEAANKIIEKAEIKAATLEADAKAEYRERHDSLQQKELHLLKREELLDTRQIENDSQKEFLQQKVEEIKGLKNRLDERSLTIDQELETVAGLTKEEAFEQLSQKIARERESDLNAHLLKIERFNTEQLTAKANDILLSAIHRLGNNLSPSLVTSHVEISSEESKGKIIGKEGRNIRAFERATGVDVLVDESPGYIVLSSFDPVRREIARVALETLLKDGRIQPTRIEEVVETARQEVAAVIKEAGEKACYDTGVTNLHPDLVSILGRLHFRTSYGQNVLTHSVEMTHLAAIIAAEVGADVAIAKAGALLHDIGKVVSQEVEGTHVDIGIRILQKYQVDERVILAMRAHHEEYPYETPEAIIVQVADAISGSRPGARRDSLENYIKRLAELEALAATISGVEKVYAIAAGREIRVLVDPAALSELEMHTLARTIATSIETQLHYPGEIKVHVIRETRVISYAR